MATLGGRAKETTALVVALLATALNACLCVGVGAQTRFGYYDLTCPGVESVVASAVRFHTQSDATIPAGLLRLHFHDCFVRGCDGSVLIDGPGAERAARANRGLRGFDVIDDAKAQLEAICPGVVSCADIVALAARDAVQLSNGPSWSVPLGRKDGFTSAASDASDMPSPTDSMATLKRKFGSKGLSTEDLVVLNGAHTLGQAECQFFGYRLYEFRQASESDPSIAPDFLQELRAACPARGDGSGKVALDRGSPTVFDTSYFANVASGFGVLESDQNLMSDPIAAIYVARYSGAGGGPARAVLGSLDFGSAFSRAMVRMGNIGVKTGDEGEVRRVCTRLNRWDD